MANVGYIRALLNRIDDSVLRDSLGRAFDYVLKNLRFGTAESKDVTDNFQLYRFDVRTNSTANDEFSFAHGLNSVPHLLIPVLPLDSTGRRTVRLQVSRKADTQRVYLRSPESDIPIVVFIEI